jgi:hypothetical protein
MIAEVKRNPMALAGELLEKIGAVDLSRLDGETRPAVSQILTNKGAIKAALEQIKLGKIPAMHVRMLDAAQELASSLASIQEECQNDIFEFHDMETRAAEGQAAAIVEQRKKAEQLHADLRGAAAIFSGITPLIVEQLIDYSPQQELSKRKGATLGK